MLRQRVLVAAVLLPVGLWVFAVGGWVFAGAVALIIGLAGREFVLLFRNRQLRPSAPLLVVGASGLVLARHAWGFDPTAPIAGGLALAAMCWHLVDYERGAERSGTDFGVTLGGVLYLGVVGAYLVSLRDLPDGLWWLLITLPAVWLGDSAAYFLGRAYGRHKMSPRLSPNKSWEGYLAGVVIASLTGVGLGALFGPTLGVAASVTPLAGLGIGLGMGAVTPLGDLGISMMKREAAIKDTGRLLPGHGGALDRIDSWLWGGILGYYLARWLAL